MKFSAFTLVLLLCACAAHGFSWGPEETQCSKMKPVLDQYATKIADASYYKIVPNQQTFEPGQKLYIRIKGRNSDSRYTYQGAMLTIKEGAVEEGGTPDAKSVGQWYEFHVNKYRLLSCDGAINAAVVEANNWEKRVEDDVFVWTAPSVCNYSKSKYTLMAVVVKNGKEYSGRLSTQLLCVRPEPTIGPMPIPEMLGQDSCSRNYSKVPKSDTGFETDFGGWWNEPTAPLRWTRQSGYSPSPQTGPMGAITGKWYIFSEASYPAEPGEKAILNNPPGLEGCACVRIECHMFGGPGLRFDFKINGDIAFSHAVSLDEWVRAYATVNVSGGALVQLVMTRGVDFRGDLAIDDITITPGMCEEDIRLNKSLIN